MAAEDVTLDATAGQKSSAPTYIDRVTIEGPASYDAAGGGYAILANLQVKLPGRSIQDVRIDEDEGNANAQRGVFLHSTGKVKYFTAAGAEVADTTNLTGETHTAIVISE